MTDPNRSRPRGLAAAASVLVLATALGGCATDHETGAQVAPDRRTGATSGARRPPAERGTRPSTPETRVPATATPSPRPAPVNPTVSTAEDPRSTFALDVDTASWTRTRAMLRKRMAPSPADVRTEEFVNTFAQDYRPPAEGIDVRLDGTAVPWLPESSRVVRVGIQSARVDQAARPDANLTFVIDVSGSMAAENKLPAVKEALRTLTTALRPTDTVAIVVYSDKTRTVLPRTPASNARRIIGAVDDLDTEGSTNAEAGLKRGYEEAQRSFEPGRVNRVVLLSDGVANVGNTGPDAILETIGDAARRQIDLVTVGFGDSFNDPLMERLADRGNGFYAYCDSAAEANRLFRENLTGTLMVTGRDAKAQVEFDPRQVATYRLLGYENRAVADDDFRNDRVDGGEVGAGHAVTALYQVELAPGADPARPLATATIRYQQPDDRSPVERTAAVAPRDLAASPQQAPVRLQQDIVVAALAESLRGAPWGERRTPRQIVEDARAVAARTPDPQVTELVEIAGLAADR